MTAGTSRSEEELSKLRHVAPPGVLILGMHRSGTSAVTRLVNLLGPSVCISDDLMMGVRTNAKGHWESRSLFRYNDTLLEEMGCSWWYPPTPEDLVRWQKGLGESTYAEARSAFDRVHPVEPWVWKDPRTCVLLSFWRRVFDRVPAGIVVYRNPLDVARPRTTQPHGDGVRSGPVDAVHPAPPRSG